MKAVDGVPGTGLGNEFSVCLVYVSVCMFIYIFGNNISISKGLACFCILYWGQISDLPSLV